MKHTGLSLLLAALPLAAAISVSAALAAPYSIKTLVTAYNSGKYFKAQEIAEKRLAVEPNDFGTRYYLANTYLKLNKTEQAIVQYRACANSGAPNSSNLAKYSSRALECLLKQKELNLMAASADKPSDKEIREFRQRLAKETQQEDQQIHREWSQALLRLSQNYDNRAFNRGYSPYEYRRMAQERAQIDQTYSKKLRELAEHEQVMLSQANCGTGRIRIAPALSSSKIKNYVNYGSDADAEYIPVDNALTAQARKLSDIASPTNKSGTRRTKFTKASTKGVNSSKNSSDIASISTKHPPAPNK
ncbi:MAG: hypothetical protein JST01_04130 [Cyanobacteria bacterium SZAS TMP-1]|nr:hypothetical protein [Cyanobacteria bacterium SZAS TMP-1]